MGRPGRWSRDGVERLRAIYRFYGFEAAAQAADYIFRMADGEWLIDNFEREYQHCVAVTGAKMKKRAFVKPGNWVKPARRASRRSREDAALVQ